MSAQFKPGDRVLVEAAVMKAIPDDGYPDTQVQIRSGRHANQLAWVNSTNVHPLPTPASHLRAAAEIFVSDTGMADRYVSDGNLISTHLRQYADRLEAAAAPKPTLREAAENVVNWLGPMHEHSESLRALRAALAREVAQS